MAFLKEQDVIDSIYPGDNTKTISNAWEWIREHNNNTMTVEEVKSHFKNILTDITDWSS